MHLKSASGGWWGGAAIESKLARTKCARARGDALLMAASLPRRKWRVVGYVIYAWQWPPAAL